MLSVGLSRVPTSIFDAPGLHEMFRSWWRRRTARDEPGVMKDSQRRTLQKAPRRTGAAAQSYSKGAPRRRTAAHRFSSAAVLRGQRPAAQQEGGALRKGAAVHRFSGAMALRALTSKKHSKTEVHLRNAISRETAQRHSNTEAHVATSHYHIGAAEWRHFYSHAL